MLEKASDTTWKGAVRLFLGLYNIGYYKAITHKILGSLFVCVRGRTPELQELYTLWLFEIQVGIESRISLNLGWDIPM